MSVGLLFLHQLEHGLGEGAADHLEGRRIARVVIASIAHRYVMLSFEFILELGLSPLLSITIAITVMVIVFLTLGRLTKKSTLP